MQCLPSSGFFGPEYRSKELDLAVAVTLKDSDKVAALLSQGVNRNGLHQGKSLLSWAAGGGDVDTLRLLLGTRDAAEGPVQSDLPTGNIGYFVVVREGGDEAAERLRPASEEVTTPEGMSELEWDAELDDHLSSPVLDQEEEEDVWSSQYKWYARILADTSQVREVEMSLSRSIAVDCQDSRGRCALHYAAEAGHLGTVVCLIESGCRVDPGDRESITPLHLAAARGHLLVVEALLKQKALINARCTDKMTPLHYSASRGHVQVVSTLLSHGANVNALDSADRSPLKLAASRDLYQVVKVLVDNGARVNIEDVKGYTALCEAVWQKNVPMARLLLEAGAKLTPAPSLLHYAILHRHSEMVEPLLEAGAMVNVRDDHGSTPLIVAAVTAQPAIIKLLINHGAHVDLHGGLSGKTALVTVLQTDRIPTDLGVILELIEGGADLDKACWDMTPINAALCHRKVGAACLLLRHGASITPPRGVRSQDPLTFARAAGALSAVQIIVLSGYNLWKNCPEITNCEHSGKMDPSNVQGWLSIQKFLPLKLSELARASIRSLWNRRRHTMTGYIKSLGLPPLIQQYLMFSDVETESCEQQSSAVRPPLSGFWRFGD